MKLRSGRGFAAFAAAFLVVATSVVLVASAAPSPRPLKYACASNLYNAKNVLHYVSRPAQCQGSGKTLVKFASDYPVYVCRKEHGGFASANAKRRFPYPRGIRQYGPAGLIRLVSAPSKCAPPTQPNETPITLPAASPRTFCAAKKGGELRWAQKVKDCDRKEFPVRLAKRVAGDQGEPMIPAADSATTDENTATNIDVLANDKGSDMIGAVDTTGTTGTVSINSDNTIKYDPAGKFESLKPGQTATDSFTYTGKKGTHQSDSATVTVTITGVNDAPVAADDSGTTDEDTAKSIAVLGNDTDVEGDTLTPGSLDTTGTKGTPTVNGDGTITYDPNHTFDSLQVGQTGTDSFKYKANDGSADSGSATVTLTITGVNDAPVLSGTESATLDYLEGSAGTPVSPGVSVADPDNANVHGATVKIGTGRDSHDALHFSDQNGISGSLYDPSTGVLTLTGSATKANYQTALRSVRFDSAGGASGDRTVSFQIEDGEALNHDSNVANRTVNVDKAPVASNDTKTLDEDSGATTIDVLANDNDPDNQGPKRIDSATDGAHGTVAITNSGNDLTYTPSANYCGPDSFTYKLNGGSTGTVNVTVTCVNDAPVNTVPGAQTVNEDGNIVFSNGFSVADVDAGGDSVQTTLAVPNGTITVSGGGAAVVTNNGTSSVQVSGSLTDVNSKLSSVTYAPDPDVNGSRTISMDTTDQGHNGSGGSKTDHDTVDVTINAVNDAPVNTMPGAQSVSEDALLTFTPSPSIQDVDAGAGGVKVTLSVGHGVLTLAGMSGLSFTTGDGTNDSTMTFTGTVNDVNAALLGLTYKGNQDYNGSDTLTLTTNDEGRTGAGGALSDTDTTGITVNAVNDAPVNSVPGAQSTNEDTAKVFSTANGNLISTSDVDVAGSDLKVTVSVLHGTLSLSGTAGLAFSTGDGTNDATMTFTGTQSNINSALAGLSYQPGSNYNGPDTLTVLTDDQGATGSGGAQSDTDTVGVNVVAQNDPPVNTVPANGTQTVDEDTSITFSPSPSIADSDAGGASVKVTLSDLHGGLTLSGTSGLSFTAGDGTSDSTMTFTGTIADVNNALAGLKYKGVPNYNGTDTVTLKTEDQGNTGAGGNLVDTDTFDVTVNAVNDGPTNTVPTAQSTNEDTAKVFSSANSNALSVADVDSDPGSLQVTVKVSNGTLTLSGTAGLSFTAGDGTNDALMTFTGTQSAINTALNGLSYQPNANYNGSDTLQIDTSDQGNTGSGGALTDSDTVAITVDAVNDGPINTVPGAQSTNEDTNVSFTTSVADIDAGGDDVKVSLSVLHGKISLNSTLGLTFTDGTSNNSATVKFTGTLAAVNAAMNTLTYAPAQDYFGPDTFTMVSDDLGHNGSGGALTDTDPVGITVSAVNDAPVLDLDSTDGSASKDTTSTFHEDPAHTAPGPALAPNASLTDVDNADMTSATVTLTNRPDGDGNESLQADTSSYPNITATYTASSGELAITSATPQPKADYLAVLKTVKYNDTTTVPNSTDRTIHFVVNDGIANSNVATATVKVVPIDIPPVLDLDSTSPSLDSSASYTEDGSAAPIAPNADIQDVDDTNMESATIKLAGGTPPDGAAESLAVTIPSGSGISIENGGYQSSTGVLKLVGSSSKANYISALQSVTYSNSSDTPDTASRSIDVVVNDGIQDSLHQTATVSVTAHNDAPVNSVPGTQSSNEDAAKTLSTANGNALSTSDVDAGSNPVKVTLTVDDGTLTLASTSNLDFGCGTCAGDGTNDTTMTFTGTISRHQQRAVCRRDIQPEQLFRRRLQLTMRPTTGQQRLGRRAERQRERTVNHRQRRAGQHCAWHSERRTRTRRSCSRPGTATKSRSPTSTPPTTR